MDLQSIKQKLTETVNGLGPQDTGVQVDWAGSPSPLGVAAGPSAGVSAGGGVNLAATVDLLQRRAAPGRPEPTDRGGVAAPLDNHVKRLATVAQKINALSLEQERAIAEMQTLQAQLSQLRPTDSLGRPVSVAPIDLHRVAVAIAEVDAGGRISLACRPVMPPSPPTRGFLPQPWLVSPAVDRGLGVGDRPLRHPPGGARDLLTESLALAKEPAALAIALGRAGIHILQGCRRLVLTLQSRGGVAPELRRSPSLSVVDSILWFSGGVIGRAGLSLLIAALPMLWSVAVAGITALMAYALYQATLAPRLSFGPLLRASLLVAGLVVGGHL